jgi:hypothetical protein
MKSLYNINCNSTWLYLYCLYDKFNIKPDTCFIIGYGQGSCINSLKYYINKKNISSLNADVNTTNKPELNWFGVDNNNSKVSDVNNLSSVYRVWINDISNINDIKSVYRKLNYNIVTNLDLIINNIEPSINYKAALGSIYYVLNTLIYSGTYISKLSQLHNWEQSDTNYVIICSLIFETANICVFQNNNEFTYYLVCQNEKLFRHHIHNQVLSYINKGNSKININMDIDDIYDDIGNTNNIHTLSNNIQTIIESLRINEEKSESYDINQLISNLQI